MKKEKKVIGIVEKVAIKIAKADANTACSFISYQPKLPASVQKLKKSE